MFFSFFGTLYMNLRGFFLLVTCLFTSPLILSPVTYCTLHSRTVPLFLIITRDTDVHLLNFLVYWTCSVHFVIYLLKRVYNVRVFIDRLVSPLLIRCIFSYPFRLLFDFSFEILIILNVFDFKIVTLIF